MSHNLSIELQYTTDLEDLLNQGDKFLLNSNDWDKTVFEKRIYGLTTHFSEIKEHLVLIYFSDHPCYRYKTLGSMHPPFSPIGDDGNSDLIELRKKRPEIFIISFWREFFSYEEIAQVLNIAHEFQHVVQYITSKESYWLCRIMNSLVERMKEKELPIEIDAERVSKKVVESIYGKKRVDEWIRQKLDKKPCGFFIRFGNYNVDTKYDLKQKTMELWQEHGLEEIIEQLRNEPNKTEKELRVLKKYEDLTKAKEE